MAKQTICEGSQLAVKNVVLRTGVKLLGKARYVNPPPSYRWKTIENSVKLKSSNQSIPVSTWMYKRDGHGDFQYQITLGLKPSSKLIVVYIKIHV